MENLSRGPTFGGYRIQTPLSPSFKFNVLSVNSQNIPCATLKRRGCRWVISVYLWGDTTWTEDFKCREVKTEFSESDECKPGSSGTLIGWISGQTTFDPLWDRMEGAFFWWMPGWRRWCAPCPPWAASPPRGSAQTDAATRPHCSKYMFVSNFRTVKIYA